MKTVVTRMFISPEMKVEIKVPNLLADFYPLSYHSFYLLLLLWLQSNGNEMCRKLLASPDIMTFHPTESVSSLFASAGLPLGGISEMVQCVHPVKGNTSCNKTWRIQSKSQS